MKASVINLGCKVNEYECGSIITQLKSAGYEVSEGYEVADIYVVNSCAVTNTAEKKSRQVLTKILKLNKNAKIIVCGCAVQANPNQFLKNKNVIAVCGNNGKHEILKLINEQPKEILPLENKLYAEFLTPTPTRTRQYIKIQDGCDYFCTYCLIPYLRGRSRSRDINSILDEIKSLDVNEIVLTGINMSDYRIDGKLALKTLIKEVDKLGKRFRISSIECNVLDDEMLQIFRNAKNFCPHFHLSLQSACNETLKRMNRRYTIEQFMERTEKIKKLFHNPCISTDLIVGFKGETDEEFNTTYANLKKIDFSDMHVFPYSVRSGTVASKMKGDVDANVVKEREAKLLKLKQEFKQKFALKNLGDTRKLLVEEVDNGLSFGYTDNYIYCHIEKELPIGSIVDVKLTEICENSIKAEVLS